MQNISTVLASYEALISGENDFIATLANTSAFIMQEIEHLNWAGFYLATHETLILGPFQGKVACTRIPFGQGVCGTAFAQNQQIVVDDVHQFEGHIACDSASNSEYVIPLKFHQYTIGVLDIDSPLFARFKTTEIEFFKGIMNILQKHTEKNAHYNTHYAVLKKL